MLIAEWSEWRVETSVSVLCLRVWCVGSGNWEVGTGTGKSGKGTGLEIGEDAGVCLN